MTVSRTNVFKRDYKRITKRRWDTNKLDDIIKALAAGQRLGPNRYDHPLQGKWRRHRACHIEGDWVLIYRRTQHNLLLERTGTHSDLFK